METNKIELQSKCAALEMKLKALTVRLHESSTNHSMEVRSLEGEQARLKTQLQTKQAQVIDNLLARVAEKDRKIHSDGEALAAKLKELETLREQFHDLSAAHDALKDTQRQNSVEMERLRKECFKAQYELSHRRATETRPPQPPPPPAFLHQPLSPKLGEAMQPVETRRLPPPPPPPEKSKSLAEMGFGQFIRKPDELNSSTNVRNLLSYHHSPRSQDHVAPHRVDTNVSAPFATEMQTFQNDVVARRELEAQLLHWHIQKEQLQAEYTKLEQMGCRSIQARRRKSDIETSLNSVDRHINQLKFRLRS
ncbi:hypothetical protein DYB32_006288 [Aphanomyces invadans]|uniref:Enkurin domain-containing protein n=1 Tax=Aphanomyces invadans TaxID=157072 RepID=A0A418ASD0_9STRA|nr:hypothetical protein DYB32_006288 [Aphanomyces invadans]